MELVGSMPESSLLSPAVLHLQLLSRSGKQSSSNGPRWVFPQEKTHFTYRALALGMTELPLKAGCVLHQNVFFLWSVTFCHGKKPVCQSCSLSTSIRETFFSICCFFYCFITCWEKPSPCKSSCSCFCKAPDQRCVMFGGVGCRFGFCGVGFF